MTEWVPPTSEQIQQEAYYLWEADGRPPGLDQEYWMRARAVLHERARLAAEAEVTQATNEASPDAVPGWRRGFVEKPMKMPRLKGARRPPRRRGPATRGRRLEGKTA